MKNTIINFTIFVICTVLLNSFSVKAQAPSVKSIEQKEYVKDEENTNLDLSKRVYSEYGEDGKLRVQEIYQSNSFGKVVKSKTTFKDKNDIGRVDRVLLYNEFGNLNRKEEVQFDFSGKKIGIDYTQYIDDKEVGYYSTDYYYNRKGNRKKIVSYNKEEKKIGEEKWYYNREDEEVKHVNWFRVGEKDRYARLYKIKKTKYDRDGNLVKSTTVQEQKGRFKAPNSKQIKEVILFEQNQMVEWSKYTDRQLTSHYARGGAVAAAIPIPGIPEDNTKNVPGKTMMSFGGAWSTDSEYDDNGNKTKTTFTESDGTISQINYFLYDKNNNLSRTKKVFKTPEGTERTEEDVTEYDNYSNPVRKASYSDGELISEQLFSYKYRE